MFEILGIDHIVLRVADLDRMIAFYCDVLGCHVERREDGIGPGPVARRVVADRPRAGRQRTRPSGRRGAGRRNLDHFCLRVGPFVAASIHAHLARHGVEAGPVKTRYGVEGTGPSIYIEDPEGNVVELKGPGEGASV